MQKKVLIIGAGISGLAAGIYAQLNGFQAEIVEQNATPGGSCTSWPRQGFTFDCCVHGLTGSLPGSKMYQLWEELGAVQGREFRRRDVYSKEADEGGIVFTAYTDVEKLRAEMMRLAPEDKAVIDEVCDDIKRFAKIDMPVDMTSLDMLLALPAMGLFRKYSMPVSTLAARFTNERLRLAFSRVFGRHDQSAAFTLFTLGLTSKGDGAYPLGGSLPLVRAMEERYAKLGGKVRYGTRVEGILVEADLAVGLRTAAGELRAEAIIAASDWHTTVFDWLGGRYQEHDLQEMLTKLEPSPSLLLVFLGMKDEAVDVPESVLLPAMRSVDPGDTPTTHLLLERKSFDPAMAPPGKGVLCVTLPSSYHHWNGLRDNHAGYMAEKNRIASEVLEALEAWRRGTRDQVEVVEVVTPLSFEKWTGNWKGSYQGWLWTKEASSTSLDNTLPGLKNLYLAGQWLSPGGGLHTAALSGRKAVKTLCRDQKVKFRSKV
ncbi:MAG: NAD(P)/FAD-dependent oxidoreductase [Methanomassiliicoccales archaeon]